MRGNAACVSTIWMTPDREPHVLDATGRNLDELLGRMGRRLPWFNEHLGVWPWSDLVSYIYRYARPSDGFQRVLELGCGAGANIPLFEKLGTDYHGIEGSPSIVQSLHEQFPNIKDRIVVGDFTKTIPFDGKFDLVVDRSSITHNVTSAIHRTLGMIFSRAPSGQEEN